MGEIETLGAEKMGWFDLPRGTSYPTFPYNLSTNADTKGKLISNSFPFVFPDV